MLPAGIVPAAPVAGEGISLAFPDPVSPVEAFPDFAYDSSGCPSNPNESSRSSLHATRCWLACSLCRPLPNRYFTSPAGSEPRLIFGIMSLSSVGNRPSMAHGVYRFVIERSYPIQRCLERSVDV